MSSSSEQKWEQNQQPLLGEEEREEQQRQHRESMEETTQHLIEDLQMERRQSMSLERTTLITADTTANAGEDDAKKNTAGTISSLDGGEKELPNQQPLAPPFRSAETFLSTASSPRGRAQAFLRNKLGPFAGGGGGGSPRSGAASSTPGTEQTLHTARESSVPLRPLLDQCEKLHREGRLRDKAIIDNLPPYMSLTELLPQTNKVALSGGHMDQRQALTHEELKKFIARCQKDFERCGATAHSLRIAVCVPNGPTLVTSLLATMHKHCCVPINPQTTVEETVAECLSTNVSVILYQRDTGDSEKKIKSVVDQLGLIPILIVPDEKKSGMFEMEGDPFRVDATRIKRKVFSRRQLKSTFMEDPRARVGLVLHTSGSSGKKKVVPITISQLAVGAIAIASSCELNDTDKCCNFMPLFHVGGICRNVLAPIFSGGSLAAMAFFDARDFWMTLKARESTWYYGAPTMHALIQKSGEENPKFLEYSKIRLVAAAAGPLPHTLSTQLRKTFNGAVVLPSYGMTECMPISCPPANYALEKPGCSGRAMCPDIAIYDPNTGEECKTDEIGAVCVRGEIVMSEYEVDKADASSLAREGSVSGKSSPALSGAQPTLAKFFDGNWFDTGDIGRLDSDGFLFITGRSKEVINRGGEIISPIEIEDAIQSHAGVSECACISVAHETLQECVGIVVVPTQDALAQASFAAGLKYLCEHVQDRLPPSKWPSILVIADSIPKGFTGKVSRAKIAKALSIPEVKENDNELDRTYFAVDMNHGTDDTPGSPKDVEVIRASDIAKDRVTTAMLALANVEEAETMVDSSGVVVGVVKVSNRTVGEDENEDMELLKLIKPKLAGCFHPKVIVPTNVIPRNAETGEVDYDYILGLTTKARAGRKKSDTEALIIPYWAATLHGVDPDMVNVKDDYFAVGGTSISAGQLAFKLRKAFGMKAMTGADMFELRTIEAIAKKIDAKKSGGNSKGGSAADDKSKKVPVGPVNWVEPHSSIAQSTLLIQLIPLFIIRPSLTLFRWTVFLTTWSTIFHTLAPSVHWLRHTLHLMVTSTSYEGTASVLKLRHYGSVQLFSFFLALICVELICSIAFPMFAIIFKWLCVGRLRPGTYRLWGSYYLRWWLADLVREMCGLGVFKTNSQTFTLYMRLMGANIGRNVSVSPSTDIAEFDLITINNGATIDEIAKVRAFEARRGGMRLSPVYIGENATVCVHAIIGPGGIVPANATLPPYTSWRERDPNVNVHTHKVCARERLPGPSMIFKLFLGYPAIMFVHTVRWAPWALLLKLLYSSAAKDDNILANAGMVNWQKQLERIGDDTDAMEVFVMLLARLSWQDCIVWFMDPFRLTCIVMARLLHETIGPLLQITAVILVKRVYVGKFKPGANPTGYFAREWEYTRRFLMSRLLPDGKFCGAGEILGKHYKYTTFIWRALGSKIGERIFWPGSGVHVADGMYDLIEIGDDVVFGSRSRLYPSDALGSLPIHIARGANVADRCIIYGGVTLHPEALLGSGGVAPRRTTLNAGSIHVGSRDGRAVMLNPGKSSHLDDEVSLRVVEAKPFGRATYLGLATYAVIPWQVMPVIGISARVLKTAFNILPVYFSWYVTAFFTASVMDVEWKDIPAWQYFSLLYVLFLAIKAVHTTLSIGLGLMNKWLLIGKRQPGMYAWDKSSYCFRWKLADQLSWNDYPKLLRGSAHLCAYYRFKGCQIGNNVCLYPTGADPPMPEPDLISIGDGACVNFAHVIAHTNTLGTFSLNTVIIRERATLCSESRVMGGSVIGPDAILLDHTLAMVGDDVAAEAIWQGWPARHVMEDADLKPVKNTPTTDSGLFHKKNNTKWNSFFSTPRKPRGKRGYSPLSSDSPGSRGKMTGIKGASYGTGDAL
ncbi:predicted protein [Bathycoccus prasinos]|uniref:Carrier domain-containing protein n=1 Tax=Bathycoccus prasinos TaxID=41875 RepID=K8E9Y5_9CHLO|nr:predicted protein [Bathycoccus prasinos]CCO14464.1 predicted protein [Bathycoccus prasinos]|eukprot:XP_007515585.1 predicted protein [Bathycoccus prasinos]